MRAREYLKREQVPELEAFLNGRKVEEVCDLTHCLTRTWCQSKGVDPDLVVDFLIQSGGFCDCSVPDLLIDLYCCETPGWLLPTSWRVHDRCVAATQIALEELDQARKQP